MDRLLAILVAQSMLHPSLAATTSTRRTTTTTRDPTNPQYWSRGDWVLESLRATDEAIGVKGEWADYVNTLAWEYSEVSTEEQQEAGIYEGPEEDAPDWLLLTPHEVPYLAVLYKKDYGRVSDAYKHLLGSVKINRDPGNSHIERGTACGGAILTINYVLSSCGCLYSLLSEMWNIPRSTNQVYDIYNYDTNEVPLIYVESAVVQFFPTFKQVVSTNPAHWPTSGQLNCKDRLEEVRRVSDLKKRAVILDNEIVVVPFSPGVLPSAPNSFAPWPPNPISTANDPNYQSTGYIMKVGFKLNKFFEDTFSSVTAAGVTVKHCTTRSTNPTCAGITCNSSQLPFGYQNSCFRAYRDYFLSAGVIGWPVVRKNKLVGLTGTPRDPVDNSVRVSLLHKDVQTQIEKFLPILGDPYAPAPLYRETELPTQFLLYNYYALGDSIVYKPPGAAKPKSLGNIIVPSAIVQCLTILT